MGLNILYDIFSVFDLYLISIIKWSIKSHNNKKFLRQSNIGIIYIDITDHIKTT